MGKRVTEYLEEDVVVVTETKWSENAQECDDGWLRPADTLRQSILASVGFQRSR